VIELNYIPKPHSPHRTDEDELSYIIDVLSREIDNIRNQLQEMQEKLTSVQQAQDLVILGQFIKVVKTEITNSLK
jgi:hypothetical protein